jgi:hypothetical protein
MHSTTNNSASAPIPFPSSSRIKATPVTEADRAIAREHDTEIHELCRDTKLALQELRQGTANLLRDTLEKLDLDAWMLIQILDERPSVVQDLIAGETDSLTTEKMVEYLERLHERSER